jgi:hypothetical protein
MIGAPMLRLISRYTLVILAFHSIGGVIEVGVCKENTKCCGDVRRSWSTSATVFGKRFRFTVNYQKLKDAPKWEDPATTNPPLSHVAAVEVSRSQLKRYCPEVESWTLSKIHLFSLGHGYWFWVIGWEPNGKSIGDGLSIPVLMSGEPIVGTLGP